MVGIKNHTPHVGYGSRVDLMMERRAYSILIIFTASMVSLSQCFNKLGTKLRKRDTFSERCFSFCLFVCLFVTFSLPLFTHGG